METFKCLKSENIDHFFDLPDNQFYAVMECFCEKTWSNTPQHNIMDLKILGLLEKFVYDPFWDMWIALIDSYQATF